MPCAYANDLRRKFLAAYGSGQGSQAELARLFGVSLGWVEKVCRQQRQTGQADRVEQRHGPQSRLNEAAKKCLLEALQQRPDLTLDELQAILAERQGVRLCIAQLWNHLKRMHVRLKKSRSTPKSATRKRTVPYRCPLCHVQSSMPGTREDHEWGATARGAAIREALWNR